MKEAGRSSGGENGAAWACAQRAPAQGKFSNNLLTIYEGGKN